MTRGLKYIAPALVGAAFALATVFLLGGSGPAVAQKKPAEPTVTVNYSARYINGVTPTHTADRIEQIHAFPGTPVFLVRTKKDVTIWERKEGALRKLMDIQLDADFQDVIFLDDHQTFIIETKISGRVYSIDKKTIVTPAPATPR